MTQVRPARQSLQAANLKTFPRHPMVRLPRPIDLESKVTVLANRGDSTWSLCLFLSLLKKSNMATRDIKHQWPTTGNKREVGVWVSFSPLSYEIKAERQSSSGFLYFCFNKCVDAFVLNKSHLQGEAHGVSGSWAHICKHWVGLPFSSGRISTLLSRLSDITVPHCYETSQSLVLICVAWIVKKLTCFGSFQLCAQLSQTMWWHQSSR